MECYPDTAEQAKLQVLLIKDIEIIDQVANSAMNKLFCRHFSEKIPLQSSANMVSGLLSTPLPLLPRNNYNL